VTPVDADMQVLIDLDYAAQGGLAQPEDISLLPGAAVAPEDDRQSNRQKEKPNGHKGKSNRRSDEKEDEEKAEGSKDQTQQGQDAGGDGPTVGAE
jgi:hypothetical protein